MAKDIGSNQFYNLMTDTSKPDTEKHAALLTIFNQSAPKAVIDAQTQDYKAFQDFMRGKLGTIDNGIKQSKDREFEMEQGLAAPVPDAAAIAAISKEQGEKLDRLKRGSDMLQDILSTMFSAEAVSTAFGGKASTDTTGVYFDAQASGTQILNLQNSLGNTQDELAKLARGEPLAPPPAPVVVPVVVAQTHSHGSEVIVLQSPIEAPTRAVFRKPSGPV